MLVHYIDGIMLIGPREQEVASSTWNSLITQVCQRMGNISNQNSRVLYLREILRIPVVWDMKR